MNGAISWMARNTVAANLFMFLLILVGFVSVFRVPQETLPEASLDAIQIRMEYLGASPDEVEEGIVRKIEEQIEGIDGVRRISSVAAENVGVVTAQLLLGADAARVLDDVKAEIDRITSFPLEAEEPQVQELIQRRKVIQLAIHGDTSERTLKELANQIKDDLTAIEGISFVRVSGSRDYEISIEVSKAQLQAYGLSLPEIASAVRRGSMDLPGGTLETRGEDILIRTKGQNYTGSDFREIVILARPDGSTVRLGDVARVNDGFQDADLINRFDGTPAVLVEVYRTGDERVLEIVEDVKAYIAVLRLPTGLSVDVWQDEAALLKSRYELMLKNGLMGLVLVILCLGLFLNSRLALWVSAGIFISFLATFAVMIYLGVTVNLISLVAFILALGIVVDDAIVIGENVFAEQENGLLPVEAAVRGTQRLATPVVFSVLTTMAAFAPLVSVPGVIGKFMRNIPIVIIAVLAFSLIESLFILPAHLSHIKALRSRTKKTNGFVRGIEWVQAHVARLLEWNINGPLDKTLHFCTRHYGLVIISAISGVLLSVGLVSGGLVRFTFFPEIEGENVVVRIEMPEGTPASRTAEVAGYIEEQGRAAISELQADLPADHPALLKHVYSVIGTQPSTLDAPGGGLSANLIDPTRAEINVEILESEQRDLATSEIEWAWRERLGAMPGVRAIEFQSGIFSLGDDIQLEVAAPPDQLDGAVNYLKTALMDYAGVADVKDDRVLGKREVKISLKPQAQTLGVSLDGLARQVRAAYYGEEALRVQRGRDEVKVMVRLPQDERDAIADLGALRIRTLGGSDVPLVEVADLAFGYGPSSINRRDRRRITTITADVDETLVSAEQVIASLRETEVIEMEQTFPGSKAGFEGEQREQADAVGAIARGFIIALFVIYALLAIPFKSYTQPFIIMAAIPFGIIGAILGHLVMGISVGILSLFGIVGLSGVVVNDSLVLIDYINKLRRDGVPLEQAVIEGTKIRFRPILLTSLTTFLGVLPLILEKSLQAQFLIPIAASLGFGILFSTFIILVLVPALVMLEARIRGAVSRSDDSVAVSVAN